MKFVLAPDSFKNALRSPEVCAALTDGIRMAQPEAEILAIPLADGGEGTVQAAALAAEGVLEQYETSGPLGAPLTAETARLPGGVAVVEMASAAGLELLSPDGCAPLEATTFGVGLLLRQLLDSGCRDFVMMQSSGRLRVVFVTTHIALAEVPRQVTPGRIVTVAKLLDEVIRREGVPHPKLAAAAIRIDHEIDRKEREIESMCLKLLLQQQPVAKDLRTVSAALKMVTDAQRIGTQSGDISEIVALGNIDEIPEGLPIREMATAVIHMVTDSIDSFVKQDGKIARSVIEYDDVVDTFFDTVKSALIALLKAPEANSEALADLLMIAKYYERIGDHAVNIAFALSGKSEKHHIVKD